MISCKKRVVLILIMLCFLTANTAFASEINDTIVLNEDIDEELDVPVEENVLSGDIKSFSSLNNDINGNHENEVNLTSDYEYSPMFDLSYTQGISISRNVTINGNGHTLDGSVTARIFQITGSNINVVFRDLILLNANADKGGAISGKCVAINCTFKSNRATDYGGAIYDVSAINCTFKGNTAQEGGAIYIDAKNIAIQNCTFENNFAGEFGGAISINMVTGTTISDSTFRNNRAQNGGSMSVRYSQNVHISDSTFLNNNASFNGGALHYDFSYQNSVDNCYFENNIAGQNGGAFNWILSNGNITNNKFRRNSATGNGGAIYINITNTTSLVNRQLLSNCNFTGNSAKNGGAIYNNDFYKINYGSFSFINNSARENGGAVYCKDSWGFSDSLFLNNSANQNGGGIYCNDYCTFFGCDFIKNSAQTGGAMYANSYCYLFDTQFMNNSAQTGGAIYSNEHCTISKGSFINNSAEYRGGAVYCHDYGILYNLKFNNNSAVIDGGAVYCHSHCEFSYTEFIRNFAARGPAIYTNQTFNVIKNSVFLLNKANPYVEVSNEHFKLEMQFMGDDNYFNAIYSWFDLNYSNVTYWNGTITNTNDAVSAGGPGINFAIEIYDSSNTLVKKDNCTTDNHGKIVYDYFDLDAGNYTCKIIHEDDDYYTEFSQSLFLTVGDFAKLNALFFYAGENGIVNLTQNFTFSEGFDTIEFFAFYPQNLTIYGNGYTIDALNHTIYIDFTNPFQMPGHVINIFNCSFINNIAFNCKGMDNILISDCNFVNDPTFKCQESKSCEIINCNFDNNYKIDAYEACHFSENNNLILKNCNFTNNAGQSHGGAIVLMRNDLDTLIGCNFINNSAGFYGGAIFGSVISNVNLINCSFINNSAVDGGAFDFSSSSSRTTCDGCIFLNNSASAEGAAIYCIGSCTLKNSIFLSNKASSRSINAVMDSDLITVTFIGSNKFINAIRPVGDCSYYNVTYWDGAITNTDVRYPSECSPGQNITLLAFDENNNLIYQSIQKTDEMGKLVYDISNLPYESRQVVFYHEDDEYYARSSNVTVNVARMGDFDKLQSLIDSAGQNGVINLTRNYTYAADFDSRSYISIDYSDVTINGNGYTINGLGKSGAFRINAENVVLNNITFVGGGSSEELIVINDYISGCEINNCNFINNSVNIMSYAPDLTLRNCNFINSTNAAVKSHGCLNLTIYNSNFINNTHAIYTVNGENILIGGCSFINNTNLMDGGAVIGLIATNIIIENSNFTSNKASTAHAISLEGTNSYISNCSFIGNNVRNDGGALYSQMSNFNMVNSTFIANIANIYGGAISASNAKTNITGCSFLNNSADLSGGAIYISSDGICTIDDSIFRFNSADEGAAISWAGTDCILKNSTLLDNKAGSESLCLDSSIEWDIIIRFNGKNNFINAIYSSSDFEMQNVVYWNGNIVNSDDVAPIKDNLPGQNITLEIYDREDNLLENITLMTDGQNKIYYSIVDWQNGNYSFKAYHLADEYYTYIGGCNGTFEINRSPSSVNINISNGTEFYYSNCNISFDIVNRTTLRVVITDISGSQVYVNQSIDENYFVVNLDPCEDYYNMTVYNYQTLNYLGSQDSKMFKILKANSSIVINPIPDAIFNNPFNITFDGENLTLVNVTVFDSNNNIVWNEITSNNSVSILGLPIGTYNVTLINNEDKYHSKSVNSTIFNVLRASNNVMVSVEDVVYGNKSVVVVIADVDGIYSVDVNGTFIDVNVENGRGNVSLSLAAGSYYANATFVNDNYTSNITNATFEVVRAANNIVVSVGDVVYGNKSVVVVVADVDGVYSVDVNGTFIDVNVENGRGNVSLSLAAGSYYANTTFVNDNYTSNITNATFEVVRAINNIVVSVGDVVYGNKSVVVVTADVDGVYTVDINGTLKNVKVINGKGSISLGLEVGKYYANTTFSNPNYNPIITNATFNVLPITDYEMTAEAWYSDEVYVYVTLPENATGNVTVHIGDKSYNSTVNHGIALIVVNNLMPGDYNISVSYSGDNHYFPKSSNITIHVKKMIIEAYDVKYGWAKSITYTVKLMDEEGSVIQGKEISFSINGKSFKSITDYDGIAVINVGLNIGSYDIKISCLFENVTKKITVVSRFSGNKNLNMYYFDGTKYSLKVYGDNGKVVGANQKVVVKLNKKTYTLKTNKNGIVSLTIPKTVKLGTFTITVTYKGQTVKNTVKVKQILSSKKKVKVKRTAKKLVLKAKLKKKLKGKKITFKFKGKKYKAKTNKKGIAKVKIKKKVIKKLKKGKKYKVKISYCKISIITKVKVKK